MMRFFILFVEIVLLIIVLRSPFAQYLFSDIQNSLSNWFVSISEVPEQKALAELRNTVLTQLAPLKPYQQEYLMEITSSSSNLKGFDRKYCQTQEINPNFVGQQRVRLCILIHQSKLVSGTL